MGSVKIQLQSYLFFQLYSCQLIACSTRHSTHPDPAKSNASYHSNHFLPDLNGRKGVCKLFRRLIICFWYRWNTRFCLPFDLTLRSTGIFFSPPQHILFLLLASGHAAVTIYAQSLKTAHLVALQISFQTSILS